MIDKEITSGKHAETSDTTHTDLKHFQDFLYRYSKDKKCYDQMHHVSVQPVRFFVTARTHELK